ncbi:MAG: radical SAM protein [Deltaproteobacteria bacterium]|nr:radical SAM protein [Deltaproteobacteria bacterium]
MKDWTPFLISWNITKRCNLKCRHCYLDAAELSSPKGELTSDEALALVDDIASINPNTMLILTGGEPLLRDDVFDIAKYASSKGLMVVLGTNGSLIDDDTACKISESNIKGIGISIDSLKPLSHDRFRGLDGAWGKTVSGIEALKRRNIDFQLQITVTKNNYDEIPAVIEYAYKKGARAVNVFFLVCIGRGQEMTDITPKQYEEMLVYLANAQKEYEDKIMVRARCAPHFLRVVQQINPDSEIMKGATSGCLAGTHYFRITPEGDVTPCPYLPTVAGNVRKQRLSDIWVHADIFKTLRDPVYKGNCKDCEFNEVCGGCRARAYAEKGDVMEGDSWCEYEKGRGKGQGARGKEKDAEILWTDEAKERLDKVPVFLRTMVKKGVEGYARRKGLKEITPDIMMEMRKRVNAGR